MTQRTPTCRDGLANRSFEENTSIPALGSKIVFLGYCLVLFASGLVAQTNRLRHQGRIGTRPPPLRSLATIAIFAVIVWGFVSYRWYVPPVVFLVATSLAWMLIATRPSDPWVRAAPTIETAVICSAVILWAMRFN